ncbi:MAG: 7-cyano-7-deazaguanine synthase QueC [Fimbriimonas sp.]
MKKAVVLFSGGLDSSTVLAIAKSQGFSVCALTIEYGQRHAIELEAASRVAKDQGVLNHRLVHVDMGAIGGSALTADIDVPKNRDDSQMADIPVTYVPARNTVMLSIALGCAEVLAADDIFVGVNAVDYSGYPDCRPQFISAFEQLANVATKRAIEGHTLKVHAPLINMTKREIIQTGIALGVNYALTHSCYDPDAEGRACAQCDSCLIRKRAFAELGMEDPALVGT